MPLTRTTGLAALICAGLFCTGTAWAQTTGDNAVQAAMDACETTKEMDDSRMNCWLGAMAMHQTIQHANAGSEGTIHVDFNTSNDSPEVQEARKALMSAVDECEMSGNKGSEIQNCRMEAFHQYQEAIAQ